MKIVLAVHHFPPTYTGGAEWRAYRTASALQARGHQVKVVCVERIDDPSADPITSTESNFNGVHVQKLYFNLGTAPDPFRWGFDNAWVGSHFSELFEKDRPDIFHLIGGYLISASALESAKQAGIPTVVTLTDFWFLCPRINMVRSDGTISTLPLDSVRCVQCQQEERRRYRIPGRLLPGIMHFYWGLHSKQVRRVQARGEFLLKVLNQVNVIISPSEFLLSMMVRAGLNSEKVVFSRQGFDFSRLDPNCLEKSSSRLLRVGYIGQISHHKGVHVLLDAVRRMPGVNLVVRLYGDPAFFPKYTQQLLHMAKGDSRVELAGVYKPEDLSRVYRDLDVIVVPSLWYENSPNVILEAFAHRTPVIVTDMGGMAELVDEGGNGLVFPCGDSDALAGRLQQLLDDPGLLIRLRDGIEPIRSLQDEMDGLETTYRQIIHPNNLPIKNAA